MHKILPIFILLLLSGCGLQNAIYQPTTPTETPPNVVCSTAPAVTTQPTEVLPMPPTTEPTKPETTLPPARNATPTEITLLVDGTFIHVTAMNIEGAMYISLADFAHITQYVPQNDGVYHIGDMAFLPLRKTAERLGLRVEWFSSRNTVLVAQPPQSTNVPIFTAEDIPQHIAAQIVGSSFHDNAHFGLSHLSYLTVTHVGFCGTSLVGHIIVAASIADEVLDIFREIYEGGFPIERIRLIDYYGADDYYSMADNNSVGFNFRYIAGTQTLSRHAWGMAIDINPIQNPFIRGDTIWPLSGAEYTDRTNVRSGMIVPGDVVYNAFTNRGWTWGGHWRVPIDYHHFEKR